MKIKLKPSDLIERFVWDKYEYFILQNKTKQEITEIIENNYEFEITEKDAFVIGLLNTIYTDEVIYKFKQFLREILDNKSFKYKQEEGRKYITRKILLLQAETFMNKIPNNYKSNNIKFNEQLEKIEESLNYFKEKVKQLECTIIQDWPCVKYGQVKKIINSIEYE